MQKKEPLSELISKVCAELEKAGYTKNTVRFYQEHFGRLRNLAGKMGLRTYTKELGRAFQADGNYINPGNRHRADEICLARQRYHNRCIVFIESYLAKGIVDCNYRYKPLKSTSLCPVFQAALTDFKIQMDEENLSQSTTKLGLRFAGYFLEYLQEVGCTSFDQIKNGDICRFISCICENKYQPTSLSSSVGRLKKFVSNNMILRNFAAEIPEHLPKKRSIIDVFTLEENEKILEFLKNGNLSSRDKAIGYLHFETGIRAVDIINMKLTDINWKNRFIHIIQSKTNIPLDIPIRSTYGRPMVDYVLNHRPKTDSEHVFITEDAPYVSFSSSSCIRA
jgi:site-specific recombinase XerD